MEMKGLNKGHMSNQRGKGLTKDLLTTRKVPFKKKEKLYT